MVVQSAIGGASSCQTITMILLKSLSYDIYIILYIYIYMALSEKVRFGYGMFGCMNMWLHTHMTM